MTKQEQKQITLSRNSLIAALLLALVVGGLVVYGVVFTTKPAQLTEQNTVDPLAEVPTLPPPFPDKTPPAPVITKPDEVKLSDAKPTVSKAKPEQPKPAKHRDEFIIEGLLSTAGEPWAANMILVKILWLKNKNQQQFLLGKETAVVQQTPNGFAYRIVLRPQGSDYLNWNGGVEGNVGRVIAFVDKKRDARLSLKQDKIIAVSKELLRYRTGRFDKAILNDVQQQNIRQAGKGYVIVRNMQLNGSEADWQVVASESPVRLDLDAAETSLPSMYNTFMKLQ